MVANPRLTSDSGRDRGSTEPFPVSACAAFGSNGESLPRGLPIALRIVKIGLGAQLWGGLRG